MAGTRAWHGLNWRWRLACALALSTALPAAALGGEGSVVRRIDLAETGRDAGLVLGGETRREGMSFAVGDGADIASLVLTLPFRGEDGFAGTLALSTGSRVIATRPLAAGEAGTWRVAVPVAAVRGGRLDLALELAGQYRCARGEGRVRIGGEAALAVAYVPGFASGTRRALTHAPRPLAIALPDRPRENQVAAALLLAAERPATFATAPNASETEASGEWTRTAVLLDSDAPALALRHGPAPGFVLGGADPRGAAILFASSPRPGGTLPLAAAGATASQDSLPLASLGRDLAPRGIAGRGGWTLYLPASGLPAGRKVERLVADLDLHGRNAAAAIATLALNGQVLASRSIEPGRPARLSVGVPDGLATTTNRIDIAVLRDERASDCAADARAPRASLRATSHLALGPAEAVTDFRDLPAVLAGGATLVLPSAPTAQGVGALSGLLAGLLSAGTPLAVSYAGRLPATGAAIWVSDRAPPGLAAPIPMDRHGARIRDVEGGTLVTAAAMRAMTLVQLLHDGSRPVLWIRPGRDFAALARLPAGAELGYGDVALYDAAGRAFAMNTERERLVRIDYEGDFDLAAWMADNRVWLVLGAWLAITALFAWLLQQTYRARRDRLESEDD